MPDSAPIHLPDRNGIEIHAFKATNIDRPAIKWRPAFRYLFGRWCAGTPERQDAAGWAEKILGRPASPLVQHQVFPGCEQSEILFRDPVVQCPSSSADGAVTDTYMVDISLDLESNPAAVTGAIVFTHSCIYA